MKVINPGEVSIAEFHSYILGAVAPRPIAFASTISKEGMVNLTPFSFFNAFGSNPPTLIFSPNKRVRDGSGKDTLDNVAEVKEVVINIIDYSMVEQASLASCAYPSDVNEFVKAGFTEVPSDLIRPPRVAESKAAFECKITHVISLGDQGGAPNLIICEVLRAHISEDILGEDGKIDHFKTDWVARMGGDWYCRASGDATFMVPKPNRHLGVGVDAIPEYIRINPMFTGNHLGRLGNIEVLPTDAEILEFELRNPESDKLSLAITLLEEHNVKEAWMAILANK